MNTAQRGLSPEEEVRRLWINLARKQFGAVTRRQLLILGMSATSIDRRISSGELARCLPGVYLVSWFDISWKQQAMAALLWAGPNAALSHASAARLWRLDVDATKGVHITVERRMRSPKSWLKVHKAGLAPRTVRIEGMAVTPLSQTLLDLAATATPDDLEEALESALRRRLTSVPKLQAFLERFCVKGRRGCAPLRSLVTKRGDIPATGSRFETRFNRLLRKAGLPLPERQVEIRDGDRFVGRVDFAYPQAKVLIEADGYLWHTGRQAWQRDAAKGNHLGLQGWLILRFTTEDLKERPHEVIERVRAALGGRLFE
ncbi:MAG TPA: type IV toxin-antitoxin system AbiEi family antitoxin domain-containing protein [Actinomycetota bacterium]|nr:type IV toxin-antitoxin system AbiEi family antitoxin domain-containing protein [Actinomycetota bacterium]